MKVRKIRFSSCITVILFFTFLTPFSSDAQRVVSGPVNSGCYRQAVQPIQSVPTLHSDMGLDCMLGYIYFDSLCRTPLERYQLDSLTNLISSWDTLKIFMRMKYRMSEYDPILYKEYLLSGPPVYHSYVTTPSVIDQLLSERMITNLGKTKLPYITTASAILHIHVTEVHSDSDTMATIPVAPLPMTCVRADILDVIKGINLPMCEQLTVPGASGYKQILTTPCIEFNFSPVWEKELLRGDVVNTAVDSSGNVIPNCVNCYGLASVTTGKDYIVFLRAVPLDYDGTSFYFALWPLSSYSAEGGIFPIDENGNVESVSDFFGYGHSVPVADFLSSLRVDIQKITDH